MGFYFALIEVFITAEDVQEHIPIWFSVHLIQPWAITRVNPYICTMPLKMDEGWNQIQLNLADLTNIAYGPGRDKIRD
ncbi:hypothetical protein L6164_005794 [Bauhinia variegata]|uniref:Uncharacterized protein n=1 Tax=Bauhinia variegata TaxID=167791 RepID=A0ACB9PXS9_BAUVA|nr:hypothetical protein L6164_005794 [Bauhinia variegata]